MLTTELPHPIPLNTTQFPFKKSLTAFKHANNLIASRSLLLLIYCVKVLFVNKLVRLLVRIKSQCICYLNMTSTTNNIYMITADTSKNLLKVSEFKWPNFLRKSHCSKTLLQYKFF